MLLHFVLAEACLLAFEVQSLGAITHRVRVLGVLRQCPLCRCMAHYIVVRTLVSTRRPGSAWVRAVDQPTGRRWVLRVCARCASQVDTSLWRQEVARSQRAVDRLLCGVGFSMLVGLPVPPLLQSARRPAYMAASRRARYLSLGDAPSVRVTPQTPVRALPAADKQALLRSWFFTQVPSELAWRVYWAFVGDMWLTAGRADPVPG